MQEKRRTNADSPSQNEKRWTRIYDYLVKHIKSTDKVVMMNEPFDRRRLVLTMRSAALKPPGFWYACGLEWIDWVASEMPHWRGEYFYKVTLFDNFILKISTDQQFEAFNEAFETVFEPVYFANRVKTIDWQRVMLVWGGIEICPHRDDRKFESPWYYGWDVASGVVWNFDAINLVTKIEIPQ